jgi:hypothetical protein
MYVKKGGGCTGVLGEFGEGLRGEGPQKERRE